MGPRSLGSISAGRAAHHEQPAPPLARRSRSGTGAGASSRSGKGSSFDHDGRTFWHARGDPPPATGLMPAGHLLQILDQVYRGYQASRMVLDSEGIVPSDRETATGMAPVDAQMVAGMKRTVGRRVVFEITPHDGSLRPSHRSYVEQAAARYAEFLGVEYELRGR